ASSPVQQFVGPYYLQNSVPETTIPNVVTSVLGSYRGFDTLGETAVVFAAAVGVLLLLRRKRRHYESSGSSSASTDREGTS
ncbi:MAG: hydrogen gas-evolving membrane-bound hydrogenase subunit E, partial [Pseudomonadota bacterium]